MKVMIISIVIGALGTVTKGLIKGLEDLEIREKVETIQTTALLRSARILRRVLDNNRWSTRNCEEIKIWRYEKWYLLKPKSVLENETLKILCDFEIQRDNLIPTRRTDSELINKKNEMSSNRFFADKYPDN